MKFYLLMIIFIFFVSCGSDSDTNNTTSNNNGSSLEIWNTAVAYWKLDEANSGIVSDHVGSNNGSPFGSTLVFGNSGVKGKAVSFGGSGCLRIPANSKFNSQIITAMAWVKTGNTLIQNILSFYNNPAVPGADVNGWAVVLTSVGKLSFWNGNSFFNSNTSSLNDGNWHHVAAVANNTSLDLYIDGALDRSHTIVPIAAYTGPGAIAADGECAQKFIGSIDEVAVWNTSLTAQDIQDVYNEQKP